VETEVGATDRERQARTSVCHLHVAELDGVVSDDEASATTLGIGDSRITVHCDLGSGTSSDNSLTVRKRRDFAGDGIE
jgi:hypothetical protein